MWTVHRPFFPVCRLLAVSDRSRTQAQHKIKIALQQACIGFIIHNVSSKIDTLLPVLSQLQSHSLSDEMSTIIRKCRIFQAQKAVQLIKSNKFQLLPSEIILQLISNDSIQIKEETIWEQCETCKHFFFSLFPPCRFLSIFERLSPSHVSQSTLIWRVLLCECCGAAFVCFGEVYVTS